MLHSVLTVTMLSHVRTINKAPMCAVSAMTRCTWNASALSCFPESSCRPANCGILQCTCQPVPLQDRTPWEVLDLDAELALSPHDVKQAFLTITQELHPDKNADCRELAGAAFISARRSRDVLLKMASALGEMEAKTLATAMVEEKLGQSTPVLHSLLRLGQRLLYNVKHAITSKMKQVKEIIMQSVNFYLRNPATFILVSVILQFLALSKL